MAVAEAIVSESRQPPVTERRVTMSGFQIGWYTVKEDKEMCNSNFECAAWYERLLVKAGKYHIVSYIIEKRVHGDKTRDVIGWQNYIQYNGTILSDYFGGLFCGVPIGSYDNTKNAGKETSYGVHVYDYALAEMALNGEIELLPDFEVIDLELDIEGEHRVFHRIARKENCK